MNNLPKPVKMLLKAIRNNSDTYKYLDDRQIVEMSLIDKLGKIKRDVYHAEVDHE